MHHYADHQLRDLLTLDETVEALRAAFIEYAADRARVQPRVSTELGGLKVNTMAALLPASGYVGAKVYTAVRGTLNFLIALYSAADGRLVATFDGAALTQLRTAAVSVLAARHLARAGSRVLTVFGTGIQAEGHVRAFAASHPIDSVFVVGRAGAAAFAKRMAGATGLPVRVATAAEAVPRSDIVVTASSAMQPLFDGGLLAPGTFISAVGSARADAAELDATAIRRCAPIAVEAIEPARHEAGELIQAATARALDWSRVIELGALAAGTAPGRRSDDEITLFDSVGFALEDVAVAALALGKLRSSWID